jgi:SAM-dependent methyltransferase
MMASFRRRTARMFDRAMNANVHRLAGACALEARRIPAGRILDLGCWDGSTTARYRPSGYAGFGVEFSLPAAKAAVGGGLQVVRADLNRGLPFADNTMDIVTSNQVIEHLRDTDAMVGEAYRVLRPGGLALISTENLASWHNIAALVLGWQAFSLTNVSRFKSGIGNPLANLRGQDAIESGWEHLRIFSYRGLLELFEAVGFVDVAIRAAGYYPLPERMARLDARHGAFITAVGRKK